MHVPAEKPQATKAKGCYANEVRVVQKQMRRILAKLVDKLHATTLLAASLKEKQTEIFKQKPHKRNTNNI